MPWPHRMVDAGIRSWCVAVLRAAALAWGNWLRTASEALCVWTPRSLSRDQLTSALNPRTNAPPRIAGQARRQQQDNLNVLTSFGQALLLLRQPCAVSHCDPATLSGHPFLDFSHRDPCYTHPARAFQADARTFSFPFHSALASAFCPPQTA